MRKLFIYFLTSSVFFIQANSQSTPENLKVIKEQLQNATHDTIRGRLNYELAFGYRFSNIDSSLYYTDVAIAYADKLNQPAVKALMLSLKGATVLEAGKLPESLRLQFEAMEIGEQLKDTSNIAFALNRIGNIYMELGDFKKAHEYYFQSMDLFEKIGDVGMVHNEMSNIGNIYNLMQQPDSGLNYLRIVYDAAQKSGDRNKYTRPEMLFRMGNAYRLKGDKGQAMDYYKRGITEANKDNDIRNLAMNNLFLATLYDEMKLPDSAIRYAYHAIQTGRTISFRKGVYEASTLLSGLFKNRNQDDSAYKYLSIAYAEKDSLTGTKRFQELQRIILDKQEQERNAEAKRIADRNKQRQLLLVAGLTVFLIIAGILYRNNKQKQKANVILESTLGHLKSTQSQLVHAEKMASLGELTAGIAHEIQNPLNFVNNFSEVSNELISEMVDEVDKGNTDEVKVIAKDVQQNLEKILHHGKRADAIVKGMLQHSRSSSGQKEPTDINALADEYLRLAYHGLRARDKSFNATTHTHFDNDAGLVNIVPQDIGRVILNLITNAFYAVSERKKQQGEGYEPAVSVSTNRVEGRIEIKVNDNGTGIPPKTLEKIFQPFFTTKPTGQGTGLGLSLSYDIVKAHGGELKVETQEGIGTSFIISLPVNQQR
jgi:two-component system, NtrC family, sensor kinase